jgi:hypothetical protein
MEFLKSTIEGEWMDLVEEFPEFILELSPCVERWYEKYIENIKKCKPLINKSELCNLRYSFECGVGWKPLIREYFIEVRRLIQMARSNGHDLHYKTCIFKEKFGELRDQGDFYGDDRSLYLSEFNKIGEILDKSITICEKCGKHGSIRREGWVKALCDKHAEERYGKIE